jgi:hypothetical protein
MSNVLAARRTGASEDELADETGVLGRKRLGDEALMRVAASSAIASILSGTWPLEAPRPRLSKVSKVMTWWFEAGKDLLELVLLVVDDEALP